MIISFFHNLSCIVCQSIILGSIVKYNVSYKCSDKITNEVFRLENINTKYSIIFTAVDLGVSILYTLFQVLVYLIYLKKEKLEDSQSTDEESNNPKDIKVGNNFVDSNLPMKKVGENGMRILNERSNNNNMNNINKPIPPEFSSYKL